MELLGFFMELPDFFIMELPDDLFLAAIFFGLDINDLSRGCTVDDIVNTVVVTAIQAQGKEKLN